MGRPFHHPAIDTIILDGILHALADPVRRTIVRKLLTCGSGGLSCNKTCDVLPASTLSFHYRVLREAGLVCSEKKGVEVVNTLRLEELGQRFPGLLDKILSF
jgi:DNA-binding transcriptional ArsR family regulator